MDNSRFSSLIYRIIGKPDRWHDDYIDVMHQILDETESFEAPDKISELAIGDQILSRISERSEALTAFETLLNKSRFKMIILDHDFKPIYHNQNAGQLHTAILSKNTSNELNPGLLSIFKKTSLNNADLVSLDYKNTCGEQLYLRRIQNQQGVETQDTFYLLLALDRDNDQKQLQSNLIAEFSLTDKEQSVLIHLVDGKSLKQIANEMFISDNTVRTHIKALFRKTNTNSQTDLVRIVLTHESQVLDSYFDTSTGFIQTTDITAQQEKSVQIASGHKITYREYGSADGYPIIVCHNGFGCRVSIPHNYQDACKKAGKRIIIPDRPGYGLTPYIKNHPKGWNKLFNEFIDAMNLESYEILGNIFGSAFAMTHAEQADNRLTRVILTSPVFVNTKQEAKYLTGILAPSVRLVNASKVFAREIYELWLKSIRMNIDKHYRNMVESSIGDSERDFFKQNNVLDLLVESFKQASSHGLDGISHEMIYCISAHNINLKKISIPVDLWWGTQDNRISQEGVENMAAQLPKANLNIREGYSEHIYYALFEEIIS